jgi:sugar phosphate isomerase/epimerase
MTDATLGAAADLRFDLPVPEFLDRVASLGLDHAEFKREYLHAPPEWDGATAVREAAVDRDLSVSFHAPFRAWNLGSFNDASRRASVSQVKDTLDDAAACDAPAVVVHGGSVRSHYPDRVAAKAEENAVRSLRECADHAAEVGVPLCLENQPRSDEKRRHTTTPDDLAAMLDRVGAPPEALGVTLDVGHAKVNGHDPHEFVDRFGDRIRVVHLHDNDGTADQHRPITDYGGIVDATDADYYAFEMKSLDDIERCL